MDAPMSMLPPSPFLNSTVSPRAVESAVALIAPPVADATAAPNSTLDPATGVDTAAGPEFADPPVPAAVKISVSDGALFSSLPARESYAPSGTEGAASVKTASSDKINEPSMTNGGGKEAPASAPSKNPDVGVLDATDCIHEIFHWVRKLMRGHQGFVLDEAEFLADVEEEPLFIRDGDHLRRWEA